MSNLETEVKEFREKITRVMASFAAIDAQNADLKQIATEVINLNGYYEAQQARQKKERDAEFEAAIAKCSVLESELSEVAQALELQKQATDKAVGERDRQKQEHKELVARLIADNDTRAAYDGGKTKTCREALWNILQFPDGILKIAGVDIYQKLKTAYSAAGGDPGQCPMPKPVKMPGNNPAEQQADET